MVFIGDNKGIMDGHSSPLLLASARMYAKLFSVVVKLAQAEC
jgi:hypothetical protein